MIYCQKYIQYMYIFYIIIWNNMVNVPWRYFDMVNGSWLKAIAQCVSIYLVCTLFTGCENNNTPDLLGEESTEIALENTSNAEWSYLALNFDWYRAIDPEKITINTSNDYIIYFNNGKPTKTYDVWSVNRNKPTIAGSTSVHLPNKYNKVIVPSDTISCCLKIQTDKNLRVKKVWIHWIYENMKPDWTPLGEDVVKVWETPNTEYHIVPNDSIVFQAEIDCTDDTWKVIDLGFVTILLKKSEMWKNCKIKICSTKNERGENKYYAQLESTS